MSKKISDRQRVITFAMGANAEQLQDMIETLKAIHDSKFKEKRQSSKRAPKTTASQQPQLPTSE